MDKQGNVELQNTIESTVVVARPDPLDQGYTRSIRGKYEENQGSNGTSISAAFPAGATLKEEVRIRKEYK